MATPVPGQSSPLLPPGTVSLNTYCIGGILVDVHGLSELDPKCPLVNVLWLLHGKDLDRQWMHPMAVEAILSWNERRERLKQKDEMQRRSSTPGSPDRDLLLPLPGLVTASIDHRNHGSRLVSKDSNSNWKGKSPFVASDLFGTYQGTAQDVSLLISHLCSYLFPRSEREITEHYVAGVSLGGHSAWQVLLREPRVKGGVVLIGSADFVRLMSRRAEGAQLDSWSRGDHPGDQFLGSEDFPPTLVDEVGKYDPAGLLAGQMFPLEAFLHSAKGQDWSRKPTPEELQKLMPIMERTLAGKKILNIWGRKDNWVPYKASAPFLRWLSTAVSEGGWFEDGGLTLQDIAVEDLGHECPRQMYILGLEWIVDVALGPI